MVRIHNLGFIGGPGEYRTVLNDLWRTRLSCGRMIRLLARPLPPPARQQVVSLSLPVYRAGRACEVPNHMTERESLVLI
jgi:hypothetical protein